MDSKVPFPELTKKRKRRPDSMRAGTSLADTKFLGFLHVRDQMLISDPNRHELEDDKGLHLIHLLLVAATAIDGNAASAAEALRELYLNVSLHGDSIQRVASYFADALAARLLTSKSPFYNMIMAAPTREEEFAAFTELYRASPYYQFAHFTANQAIIEAFEAEEEQNNGALHVIDFDVCHGFQWPSLIQSLSEKATRSNNPISLYITGLGRDADELSETQKRLVNFVSGCPNLDFKFEGVLRSSTCSEIQIRKNATVAVNLVLYLNTMTSSSETTKTLESIHLLKPSVVTLVEKEGFQSSRTFLQQFMESLYYYAAMFDSLHDCLPAKSLKRLSIEKNHLGREIKSVINTDMEGMKKGERLETWRSRMERVGFEGVEMSSRSVSQAKLLLKINSHCSAVELGSCCGGFRVSERDGGRAISLGWQDRDLITASAWRCLEQSNSLTLSDPSSF